MKATQENPRLHVLIAGAGIGGLFAAIALRHAGHHVEIFESSRFATELGAAIHLPPNVNGLLRRFGLNPEAFHCNYAECVTVFDSRGNIVSSKDMRDIGKHYPYPWQLSHRIDLHEALKSSATSPDGPGIPAIIHLRSKVIGCDPDAPSVILDDGEVVQGDLLIGADGVHSVLRDIIAQEDIAPQPSGGSAFRFLIPMSKIKANPETRGLVAKPGELQLWDGQFRRLVIYPCRNNTELNFVCLHPDVESKGSEEGWHNSGSLDQLLKIYDEFCPAMKALLGMVDPEAIKLWRLLDRQTLKTWIRGKSCLLGDAAHPFLPHQGQGGAQAIEDGAALGALFPYGTRREDIPRRLQLYFKCRYDRATLVQNFSRQAAFKTSPGDKVGGISTDPLEFSKINFGHDSYDYAQNMLLKSLGTSATSFNPLNSTIGPPLPLLTGFSGISQTFGLETRNSIEISFRARRNYLETFLPTTESRISTPGGWATATFIIRHHKAEEWAGGCNHISLALIIPHVILNPNETDTKIVTPFILDNSAEYVLAGREEFNLPLVHTEIREDFIAGDYSLRAGRNGQNFFQLDLTLPRNSLQSNGHLDNHVEIKEHRANITLSDLTDNKLEALFPSTAHLIRRLQRLEIAQVVKVSSDIFLSA